MSIHAPSATRTEGLERRSYSLRKSIEVIKESVPIEQLASEHGEFKLLGSGRLLGRCVSPLHEDKTPSMTVFTDSQRFKCFGCGLGGDVIDLEEMAGKHADTWTAVVALSTRYNVKLYQRPERSHHRNKDKGEKARIRDVAEDARKIVRRKRLFKVLVLTGPEFDIKDPDERRKAVAEAWQIFSSGMRRIGQ